MKTIPMPAPRGVVRECRLRSFGTSWSHPALAQRNTSALNAKEHTIAASATRQNVIEVTVIETPFVEQDVQLELRRDTSLQSVSAHHLWRRAVSNRVKPGSCSNRLTGTQTADGAPLAGPRVRRGHAARTEEMRTDVPAGPLRRRRAGAVPQWRYRRCRKPETSRWRRADRPRRQAARL